MKIPETKYKLGDKVWAIVNDKVEEAILTGIDYSVHGKVFEYTLYKDISLKRYGYLGRVTSVFATKEELIKQL